MNHVILQPAGNKGTRSHYADTIEKPVGLGLIRKHISSDLYEKLSSLYPHGVVPVWGVTPGEKDVNKKKWQRILTGDVTLFAREGAIVSSAVVTEKTSCESLAVELWRRDEKGQTWEYIYFLDEVQSVRIPYADFNKIAGYAPGNVIQGFNVLDEAKSLKILEHFDLESGIHFPDISESEYQQAVASLIGGGPLDVTTQTKSRAGQGFLRKFLFGI